MSCRRTRAFNVARLCSFKSKLSKRGKPSRRPRSPSSNHNVKERHIKGESSFCQRWIATRKKYKRAAGRALYEGDSGKSNPKNQIFSGPVECFRTPRSGALSPPSMGWNSALGPKNSKARTGPESRKPGARYRHIYIGVGRVYRCGTGAAFGARSAAIFEAFPANCARSVGRARAAPRNRNTAR